MSGLKGFDSWVSCDRDSEESYKHDLAMERAIEDILMDDDEVFGVIQHYVESLATIDLPAIAADDGAMALAELARMVYAGDGKAAIDWLHSFAEMALDAAAERVIEEGE